MSAPATVVVLPARDLEVLEFERTRWRYLARKEAAIRERFGVSLTRYFQRLDRLVDHPAAEVYDPELVRRLRRQRDARRAERSGS